MFMLYLSYVPYDSSQWQAFWNTIMRTIGAACAVGLVVFAAIMVISVFKAVFRYWL